MGAMIATLFGSLAGFFATWVTKKTALGLAAVTVFATLTVALMAVLTTAISAALTVSALPQWVLFGFAYFMPSNLPACVSAVISAQVAASIYRWNVENLRLVSAAT